MADGDGVPTADAAWAALLGQTYLAPTAPPPPAEPMGPMTALLYGLAVREAWFARFGAETRSRAPQPPTNSALQPAPPFGSSPQPTTAEPTAEEKAAQQAAVVSCAAWDGLCAEI